MVLASSSPRRHDLLKRLGLSVEVHPTHIEEPVVPAEAPERQVHRLAARKAAHGLAARRGSAVLAADTLVVLDGADGSEALGKPRDIDEARAMIYRLSGREHRVLTGVALARPDGHIVWEMGTSWVTLRRPDRDLIEWYLTTDEPYDKAGGYGVQGAAALFVSRLEGSWTNVVGLPLDRLPALFAAAGYDLAAALRTGRLAETGGEGPTHG